MDATLHQEFLKARRDHALEQRKFVFIVVVKGGPIQRRGFRYILHGNFIELLRFHELCQGLLEQLAGTPDTRINDFLTTFVHLSI